MTEYTKDECIVLLKLSIADANKAIEFENYASAASSLENAAFWAHKASKF